MRTYAQTIKGTARAQSVVRALVDASQWFQFEPLPNDVFEITVMAENKALLQRLAK